GRTTEDVGAQGGDARERTKQGRVMSASRATPAGLEPATPASKDAGAPVQTMKGSPDPQPLVRLQGSGRGPSVATLSIGSRRSGPISSHSMHWHCTGSG